MRQVEKKFLNQTFKYKTLVNEEGQALWTEEIDGKFIEWISDLRSKERDLFKVQYAVSHNAFLLLDKLKHKLGASDESLLVRAMTITFINYIDTRKGHQIMKKLSFYNETKTSHALMDGEVVKKNLYFSATGMRDIESYSELTGMKKSAIVANAIYSVLLISINEDEEIKKFWEKEVIGQINNILKAS